MWGNRSRGIVELTVLGPRRGDFALVRLQAETAVLEISRQTTRPARVMRGGLWLLPILDMVRIALWIVRTLRYPEEAATVDPVAGDRTCRGPLRHDPGRCILPVKIMAAEQDGERTML
jgi:hypothetical protein